MVGYDLCGLVSYFGHFLCCAQADLFGSKYVGANHGRMLLASSAASLAGPSLLMWLRSTSERKVMQDLFAQVDPLVFQKAFGVGTDHYDALVEVRRVRVCSAYGVRPSVLGSSNP